MPYSKKLQQAIESALKAKGGDYRPRTKHLLEDGTPKYTNRLITEGSPYLLQHAHNPVDWYGWGDEAFETAKTLNRPVLLSVGYATCHWCHVMEEESFEDEEIAQFINAHYVPIKVDREERPDVDAIYMAAVQAISGRGGWPMTVWLTPDRLPFYGGTYMPPRDGDRGVSAGFLTVLKKISAMYHTEHVKIKEAGDALTLTIQKQLRPISGSEQPGADLIHRAMEGVKTFYDSQNGGMSGKPKFPSNMPVRLLLRYYRRTGDKTVLDIARNTLEKMAAGGIYDHVGGGFHRYAVDAIWLVPHFEKMLYDNALLAMTYLEGFQATGDDHFRRITEETLDYVNRDMTSHEGAFYSATDADSLNLKGQREEGYYFTWMPEELDAVLGEDRAAIVKSFFAVGKVPNFEGRHILYTPKSTDSVARALGVEKKKLMKIVTETKKKLYIARNERPLPIRDEKILTAWNGLMISAYARAGLILNSDRYTRRAIKAAEFIIEKLYLKSQLYRSYKDGKARHTAYLDDYAFFIAALIDLYEATQNTTWLKQAIALEKGLQSDYEDSKNGGFFMTHKNQKGLIAREKPSYDGAEPSGNSVMTLNLLRLAEYTARDDYRKRAEKMLTVFLGRTTSRPMALTEMLIALDFYLDEPKEIVIVTPSGKPKTSAPYMSAFRKIYLPNRTVVFAEEGQAIDGHAKLIPVARNKAALTGKATGYVCLKGLCKLPATDPTLFHDQISEIKSYPE